MYHIADRTKTYPSTMARNEEGGVVWYSVASVGSVFQLVRSGLRENMDDQGKQWFDLHLKPLARYEPAMDAFWYMKRGVRYWPWWVLWQVSTVLECVVVQSLWRAWKMGFIDVSENETFRWKHLRVRWGKTRVKRKGRNNDDQD